MGCAPADIGDLVYTSDDDPGIRRKGRARVRYVDDATGSVVRREATLARIAALAVPPAWEDVWICAEPNGHLQATGRDQRARKQYRYHTRFRAQREQEKFADLVPFGESLGALRRRIDHDLDGNRGWEADRVLALALALLDRTRIRVGNDCYAKENGTYGLTTLQNRHVDVQAGAVRFRFVGKGGKRHQVALDDRRLARLVRACGSLPGRHLLQYEDDGGELRPITSDQINAQLRALTGLDVTAKWFRTWGASVEAAARLAEAGEPASAREARSTVLEAVDEVADLLGNTRTVCRASYVHPAVPAAYEAGRLADWWQDGPSRAGGGLEADERRLLVVL
ncbi:MAG: DNA topoisomerase IB, partial [Acidimicrobiia bacterium]|nr:DNA topoisomerase IB [Acidimicrobiia bacterium]